MARKIKDDDDVINLRDDDEEPEFKINRFEDEQGGGASGSGAGGGAGGGSGGMAGSGGSSGGGGFGGAMPLTEGDFAAMKPYDKVKVKFDKFVNLIATHAYEEIFERHLDEDVIISTDLLADLANAHEERQNKKTPLIFILGILLGVFVAWILLRN